MVDSLGSMVYRVFGSRFMVEGAGLRVTTVDVVDIRGRLRVGVVILPGRV